MKDKLYVVRKYVMAPNARAALRRERNVEPCDVWLDDDWMKAVKEQPELPKRDKIGF